MPDGTDIKPDQLRSVASDIEALGTVFDQAVQFANQVMLKPEHLGKLAGKSAQAGQAFTTTSTGLAGSLGKGAAFVKGVAAGLKSSADQHEGTEQDNKQNIAGADGGA
jgi:hypothetical protein